MVEASKDSGKHCLRPRTKQYICEKSWMLLLFPPFHIHVIFFLIQLLMDILHSKQVTIPTHSLRPEGAENITFGSQVSDLQSGPSMMSWVDPHPFNRVDPHPFNWVDPHPFDLRVWIDSGHHWQSGLYYVVRCIRCMSSHLAKHSAISYTAAKIRLILGPSVAFPSFAYRTVFKVYWKFCNFF